MLSVHGSVVASQRMELASSRRSAHAAPARPAYNDGSVTEAESSQVSGGWQHMSWSVNS